MVLERRLGGDGGGRNGAPAACLDRRRGAVVLPARARRPNLPRPTAGHGGRRDAWHAGHLVEPAGEMAGAEVPQAPRGVAVHAGGLGEDPLLLGRGDLRGLHRLRARPGGYDGRRQRAGTCLQRLHRLAVPGEHLAGRHRHPGRGPYRLAQPALLVAGALPGVAAPAGPGQLAGGAGQRPLDPAEALGEPAQRHRPLGVLLRPAGQQRLQGHHRRRPYVPIVPVAPVAASAAVWSVPR